MPAVAAITSSGPSTRPTSIASAETKRTRALDHELEHRVDVGLAAERERDVHHGRERRDALLELVALAGDALMDTCVFDGDRGPSGQRDDRFLVRIGERARSLLGQIEVAERDPVDEDRHAEERRHAGVVDGKPVRARVAAHVFEPKRLEDRE